MAQSTVDTQLKPVSPAPQPAADAPDGAHEPEKVSTSPATVAPVSSPIITPCPDYMPDAIKGAWSILGEKARADVVKQFTEERQAAMVKQLAAWLDAFNDREAGQRPPAGTMLIWRDDGTKQLVNKNTATRTRSTSTTSAPRLGMGALPNDEIRAVVKTHVAAMSGGVPDTKGGRNQALAIRVNRALAAGECTPATLQTWLDKNAPIAHV